MNKQAEQIENILRGFPEEADQRHLEKLRALLFDIVHPDPPRHETFWHYTSAQGLLGIIGNGTLFASHVSGLNDASEYMHFARLLSAAAGRRIDNAANELERSILQNLIKSLEKRNVVASGRFITCFSTAENDLGQWRGYGGDGCAFSIEFEGEQLVQGLSSRPWTEWLRVVYSGDEQKRTISAVLDYHVSLLEELGLGERFDAWDVHFGDFHRHLYDLLHLVFKHHKFSGEAEHRIATQYLDTDDKILQFGIKKSMLTRRLEVDWSADGRLPIRSVMVGPGQLQEASVVAVGDLLKLKGYKDVPVTKSDIPYRLI